jgi:Mn-dependent DtxR family transcriptional regulator
VIAVKRMRARKIDDQMLIGMVKEGKLLQKDMARELGVSEPAVCKRLKRLFPERYAMPDSFNSLTEKEQRFVLAKAQGKSNVDAALSAFDCTSRESAKVVGSQLMAKEEIKMGIEDALNTVGLNRFYRMFKLRTHVDSHDPVVGLKALDMSMKAGGDYSESEAKEKPVINLNLTKQEIEVFLECVARLPDLPEEPDEVSPGDRHDRDENSGPGN